MATRKDLCTKNPKRKRLGITPLSPIPSYRLRLVFLIICLCLGGLIARMAWLQIIRGPDLEARARDYQTKKIKPLRTRRSIVDRKGRLVALDEKRFRLYAHPEQFKFSGDPLGISRKPQEVARRLSNVMGISFFELTRMLEGRRTGVKVAESLSPQIASQIHGLRINGLDLEPYPQRVYPQYDLFSNTVGFLDYDRIPQAGLELSLNKKLSSKEKTRSFRFGRDGTPLPNDLEAGVFAKHNYRLNLTLDARLQEVVVEALKDQVKEWNATKGVAIVMNVDSGELLALASTPTYDPNQYWKYSPVLFKEWSAEELFEPGSTFKPINLALALQENVINPNGKVYDSGVVNVGGWSLKNWNKKANGLIDYPKVLQVSSNVGMVNIMKELDPSIYWDWLSRLGINKSPITDLPGAVPGHLKPKDIFVNQPIEPAVASFGQGFSITFLKLVQLHALIANGGKLVNPHITKGFNYQEPFISQKDEESNQLLKPEVTKMVLDWMETVVEEGSGKKVKIKKYRIGGKTGTADKSLDGKGYSSKICSFVAILPLNDPKFVVGVAVDNPQKEYAYGSTVAAPVAKKIIESLIVIEKIPPSPKER